MTLKVPDFNETIFRIHIFKILKTDQFTLSRSIGNQAGVNTWDPLLFSFTVR